MKTTRRWLLAVSCTLFLAGASRGDTLPEGASASAAEDAKQLIEQLDAPEFSERQEASRKLGESGRAVFPQIEKAAEAGTREVASRGIEILRSHFQGGDDETKQAAKASLERLAKSGNPAAAQRATEALTPPQQNAGVPIAGNFGVINPAILPLMQQRIQLGGIAAPGVGRRTTMRSVNGKREVEQQEGDKVTKVRDGANGGIEAEITEKVNGKETTRKVEAKDLNDLKQKEPAAAEIYERYANRPTPGTPEALKKQLESLDRSMETYKARLPNDPNVQRSIDSLKRIREQIEQRLKDAEKAAAPPAP